jgi:hypothetical protein
MFKHLQKAVYNQPIKQPTIHDIQKMNYTGWRGKSNRQNLNFNERKHPIVTETFCLRCGKRDRSSIILCADTDCGKREFGLALVTRNEQENSKMIHPKTLMGEHKYSIL